MRWFTFAAVVGMLVPATNAGAAMIETNWTERVDYPSAKGFLRVYVRKIQLTRSTWTAYVGLTNASKLAIRMHTGLDRPSRLPFTYWAGPGIWWSSRVSGGTAWPGAGTVLTHAARATAVRPRYVSSLGAGKSWFGTFSGPLTKVPKDRLLRIGFGTFEVQLGRSMADRYLSAPVSTTHQFKLPRRLT